MRLSQAQNLCSYHQLLITPHQNTLLFHITGKLPNFCFSVQQYKGFQQPSSNLSYLPWVLQGIHILLMHPLLVVVQPYQCTKKGKYWEVLKIMMPNSLKAQLSAETQAPSWWIAPEDHAFIKYIKPQSKSQ